MDRRLFSTTATGVAGLFMPLAAVQASDVTSVGVPDPAVLNPSKTDQKTNLNGKSQATSLLRQAR